MRRGIIPGRTSLTRQRANGNDERAVARASLEEPEYFKLSHHEDDVINHRLNWLLAGQPLLFLAYANVITAKVGKDETIFDPVAYKHAAVMIPWLGGLLAFGVWLGVLGAVIALEVLRRHRASGKTPGVYGASTLLGLVPPFFVPIIFMMVWWRIAH